MYFLFIYILFNFLFPILYFLFIMSILCFFKYFQIDLTSFYNFLVVLNVSFPTAKQTGEAVKKFSDFLGELGTA